MWRVSLLSLALVVGLSQLALAEGQQVGVKNEYNNSNIYNYGQQEPSNQNDDQYGIKTFRDPETGDRITQVRTKRYPPQQPQSMPIYVQPRLGPHF